MESTSMRETFYLQNNVRNVTGFLVRFLVPFKSSLLIMNMIKTPITNNNIYLYRTIKYFTICIELMYNELFRKYTYHIQLYNTVFKGDNFYMKLSHDNLPIIIIIFFLL